MVSITFANPEYLWFLLVLPLLYATHFFMIRHAKRRAMKFANFAVIKRATGQKLITKNYTILFIRMIIILFTVFAVAGTTFLYEGMTNENAYVIALDTSSSMTAQDVPPSRLEAAKLHAGEFITQLDSHADVGLISFSGVNFIEQPLTKDKDELKKSLQLIETTASGTDIPGAIITGTNLLANTDKGRAIILITDGSNTIESFQSRSVQRATDYAKRNRVKVYTIGVGSDMDSPVGYLPIIYNVTADYNSANLRGVANATGGQHYDAIDNAQIQEAYATIRATDRKSVLSFELTGGLMLLALMFIMIEWGLINTRFRSLP